jgi:cytochrome P450
MIMPQEKGARFPIGATITLAELSDNPYPLYARLREVEPISWLPALGMYYVTRYEDVRALLLDPEHFTTASEHSTIFDTFGAHMLTVEGKDHDHYRASFQSNFTPGAVKRHLEEAIRQATDTLITGIKPLGRADLRHDFAARLPVQTMLLTFGMSLDNEPAMRGWYDSFEAALANFNGDAQVRTKAHHSVAEFHSMLDEAIERAAPDSLIGGLLGADDKAKLSHDEIKRNLSIIFFGGISTVEALILNALRQLLIDTPLRGRIDTDRALIPKLLDETMRWAGPVQSATRHVTKPVHFGGIDFITGDTVNCMIAAANHDPAIFANPDHFDIDRPGMSRHLGFAMGSHHCLGLHLAKAEARIAIEALLDALPNLTLTGKHPSIFGHEFRQPKSMKAMW